MATSGALKTLDSLPSAALAFGLGMIIALPLLRIEAIQTWPVIVPNVLPVKEANEVVMVVAVLAAVYIMGLSSILLGTSLRSSVDRKAHIRVRYLVFDKNDRLWEVWKAANDRAEVFCAFGGAGFLSLVIVALDRIISYGEWLWGLAFLAGSLFVPYALLQCAEQTMEEVDALIELARNPEDPEMLA